jgi:fumarate hydratase, class I
MKDRFIELIRRASTSLPADVQTAIVAAASREEDGSRARRVLMTLLQNASEASRRSLPICQDSGTLIFNVWHGPGFSASDLKKEIGAAVVSATERSWLRPNAVDPVTGANSGNNLGSGAPLILFHDIPEDRLEATLLQKGGGSENVSTQYSLPDAKLGADRDLDGVRRCILDAAFKAQGFGCAPGTLGVGIGGDRMTSYMTAKEQLLRRLDDTNPVPALASLEEKAFEEINSLGIGPMGFGGRTTALGVKIGARHRVPASFFVSVAYMCWAFRRCTMKVAGEKVEYIS